MENQPMTAADLAALEALIGKSDALPWEVQNDGWTIRVEQQDAEKDRKWRVAMTHNSGPNRVEREVANAELIVAAVNALPGMISYVRELERERDTLAAIVRAADAMRAREHAHDGKTRGCVACSVIAAYDERRAKWKDNT